MISQLLELPSAPMEIISGIVWQLGRKNRRELYYVRRFCDEEMAELRSFLALHPKAVLIVSTQTDKETYSTTLGLNNYCVAVQDFITMDEKYRLTADWSKVELDPLPSAKTKPAAKRGDRAVNIEKLIVELKEHCKAAKSNYEATQKTLPCLTQKEIAKRVGISQREVSRCLNDPNADLLNLYWKQAKNS
jgi:DNA-directed RNA polymerase specialized sigma subunit